MKALKDPDSLLSEGLAAIRAQFQVPATFPPEVLAAAEQAAQRPLSDHTDRTDQPFVTLDPASSTDLDQAFSIEVSGNDLLLHYAIADVPWFVRDGDPIDTEAWTRGETLYLPGGKAGLHPPRLAEDAASLLPGGPRAAVVFTTSVAPDGAVKLQAVERAVIRSQAKLGYETAGEEDLPAGFAELARRITDAEEARGAARVDPPEQEVERDEGGHFTLLLRPQGLAEQRNAALSLATNLAVADALYAAKTGLFRVMAGPDARAVARLRHTAEAFGLAWPAQATLEQFEKTLNAADPAAAAFMLAIRRAGNGASYVPYAAGQKPWHAAMAATYCHMTAPLRRLADRYVIRAALSIAGGRPVEPEVEAAFQRLGPVMGKADARAGQIERAVVDLAEAAVLAGREGESFSAVVTQIDESGTRIQLCDLPVVARTTAHGVKPGDRITVRLDAADPVRRLVGFSRMA
ncbi:MAG: RNB domain-containing ribonuclease [Novosphingobium sp.]|uniref:RNB domain-containing ribonuclease n=1 Tax=Novosphingobium sp. TaxID=1874826 RepID=UPI003C7CDE92